MKKASSFLKMPLIMAAASFCVGSTAWSQASQEAFSVFGQKTSLTDVEKADPGAFYELEKQKYQKIESEAKEAYLKAFWEKQGRLKNMTAAQYQEDYFKKNVKVSESEVKTTLEKYKDHPKLSQLPQEEQNKQIKEFLEDRDRRTLIDGVIEQGIKSKDLVINYPRPKEPVYPVNISDRDIFKYSSDGKDNAPVGCKGAECKITVIEWSEFQCPFCSRVLPDIKKVMDTYKGKIRWTVKDFPLSFHDRAKPAAIVAKCAGFQGKYWQMYYKLFDNQTKLSDQDFKRYAEEIGLKKDEFDKCLASPKLAEDQINANLEEGMKLGVNGTPAFFINGRRLSGAVPFADFQRIIEEELAGKPKS